MRDLCRSSMFAAVQLSPLTSPVCELWLVVPCLVTHGDLSTLASQVVVVVVAEVLCIRDLELWKRKKLMVK